MLEWFADIGTGVINVFDVAIFSAALIGVIVGVIIGVLPGLGPPVAISLAIPLTYSFSAMVGLAVMLGIYKGGTYGGSISAILINTPGTPAASATVFDGYPLARQGKAGKALDIALYASVFGDAFSIMILLIIAKPLASVAAMFGPTELFSLMLFAMTIIAGLAGKFLVKGLIAAALGLAVSLVGMDPVDGLPRFSYGTLVLEAGLNIIPIIVGLFAISEQLSQVANRGRAGGVAGLGQPKSKQDTYCTLADFKRCFPAILTGSAVGSTIGALPGTGAATAAFLSYGIAKKRSKHSEEFGKGSIEGVAAPEAGNNAVCGGALIPMLTLGIPGDVITAILMGALMIHGIQTGPGIFVEHRAFVFTLFGMLLVSVIMLLIVGKIMTKLCRRLAELPQAYITTSVILLCILGTYAVGFSMSDVWIMMFFGLVGFVFIKMDVPLPPFIIAFILAPKMEQSLRQALLIADGNFSVLVTRPISALFLALTLFAIVQITRSLAKKSRPAALSSPNSKSENPQEV